jgi:Fe-S-cluster containining protein
MSRVVDGFKEAVGRTGPGIEDLALFLLLFNAPVKPFIKPDQGSVVGVWFNQMNLHLPHLMRRIHGIYREYDRHIRSFQMATGIRCPDRCGMCCQSRAVEATVLECLPLAYEVFNQAKEEEILMAIEEKTDRGDLSCVLYAPDQGLPGNGRCTYYEYRPLVCRLFGFAAQRDKFGEQALCLCGVVKKGDPAKSIAAQTVSRPAHVPVFQDSFMKIASLHPGLGPRLLPINMALKQSLEYVFWKYPRCRKIRWAA